MMEEKKSSLKSSKIINIIKRFFAILIIIGFAAVFVPNAYVCLYSNGGITTSDKVEQNNADCILVLGAGVNGSSPSLMLQERLDVAIKLYKNGNATKILMSGDHGGEYYNEVGVMKAYAIEKGVAASDIFMDHAGFSTYESLYRAKEVFGCNKILAVTQKYHLYRTVYLGKRLGIDIVGVDAEGQRYAGQLYRDLREILARDKDFITGIFMPKPSIPLGEKIPITGDGNVTNDDAFIAIAESKNLTIN